MIRARNRCEYCLLHQDLAAASHPVDHIVSEKHGGATVAENLALSCLVCNLRKGSDIASLDPRTGRLTSLFHPRIQRWEENFVLDGPEITGITAIGRTTAAFLQFNEYERIIERELFMRAGVFPIFKR